MKREYAILNTENGHISAITFPSKKAAEEEVKALTASVTWLADAMLEVVRVKGKGHG